jgi:signal transduction histidine kinase
MGFGLTISKMIATQLNGTISAESVYSKGSKFTFEIQTDNDRMENDDLNIEENQMNH